MRVPRSTRPAAARGGADAAHDPGRFAFGRWTPRVLGSVLVAFLVMLALEFPFVFFFDTTLTDIGFLYVYFWALPQAALLAFVAFELRVRWTGTALVGLAGLIGVPIDYTFEWVVERNLLAPEYALLYLPLYVVAGLAADLSLMALRPEVRPALAALGSALVFTAAVLLTTVVASTAFYPPSPGPTPSWLSYGPFLVPYALATGALGGYLGYCLSRTGGRSGFGAP